MTPPRITLLLATALLAFGCTDPTEPLASIARPAAVASARNDVLPGRYLVVFRGEQVPPDFNATVAALGGTVDNSLDDIGVATVSGLTAEGALSLAGQDGVTSVEPRMTGSFNEDSDVAADDDGAAAVTPALALRDALAAPTGDLRSPTMALHYSWQWNLLAIHADEAWAADGTGWDKARVAIIDTGIDYLHPELAGLVDMDASVSFSDDDAATAAMYPGRELFTDRFWHGTANASLVASVGRELAGVNQQATLIAVKVTNGAAPLPLDDGLPAIYWSVKHRADVMSFGGGVRFNRTELPALYEAYVRAFEYAWRKGALSVAPAGDAGRNRDLDLAAGLVGMPCDAPHVMCASLTAPTAAQSISGPWTNVDALQPTNNYGSDITVAAPGGSRFANTRIWLVCTTSPSTGTSPTDIDNPTSPTACQPGATFTGYAQGVGTSWSSATVAGLAAMLVSRYGHNHPDLIRQRIIDSADDLGAPGWDPFYGWGRVNAARAMDVANRRGRNDS